MKIGYIRISTTDQNTARQEVLMKELGAEQVFIDRMSGKNTDRPELKRMMSFVREGDTVIVESISRFARNTKDLLELVEQLTKKRVEFVSKKEAIDTSTPTGKFMLTVFGAVAIIPSWVGIFISYKFLAANYFIALGDEHPIQKSFGLTKRIFGEYLLLGLSFLGYVMLGAGIGVLLQYLITGSSAYNLYLPQLQIFNSFVYGVGFFLTPYILTTEYFWFKQKESSLRQI